MLCNAISFTSKITIFKGVNIYTYLRLLQSNMRSVNSYSPLQPGSTNAITDLNCENDLLLR